MLFKALGQRRVESLPERKNPLRGKMTKIILRNETYSQNETKAICDGTHDDNSGA